VAVGSGGNNADIVWIFYSSDNTSGKNKLFPGFANVNYVNPYKKDIEIAELDPSCNSLPS
jgi:hypothetical protein